MIKLKEYQKAGVSFTLFPLIPTYLLYKYHHAALAKYFIVSCLVVALICFANKNAGEAIFNNGKKLGKKLGEIFSVIALFFTYIFAVLPTGLIMKLIKRDRLQLKKTKSNTYWKDITAEDNYEYQF